MRRSTRALGWALMLLSVGGCSDGRGAGGASGEDATAGRAVARAGQMEMAAGAYVIEVVNEMSHEMIVHVISGEREVELGPVPGGGFGNSPSRILPVSRLSCWLRTLMALTLWKARSPSPLPNRRVGS